jgi:glycosyltransferase involved in cell wall biosynthesis
LLRAFAGFVKDVPDALLLLVGKESPTFKIRKLLNQLELTKHVRITGYVPYEEYFDYIALSDVCVNLRYPTVRATSANILKIMAFAKPVLVSDLCELLDIPNTACLKIPLDDTEEAQLLNALHTLHADREYRETLGQQARAFVEQHHSMHQAAESYLTFCREIVNG